MPCGADSAASCTIVRALADVPRELAALAKPGDLIVLLGAGSIGSIAGSVLSALGSRRLNACHRTSGQAFSPGTRQAGAQARRTVRRGAGAPRWPSSCVGLALYAGHRAVAVVVGLEMFQVDRINVRGNHRLSNGEVLALLRKPAGPQHSGRRSRRVAARAAELAVGRRRVASPDAAVDGRRRDSGARAARHRPHQRRRCISSTIAAP